MLFDCEANQFSSVNRLLAPKYIVGKLTKLGLVADDRSGDCLKRRSIASRGVHLTMPTGIIVRSPCLRTFVRSRISALEAHFFKSRLLTACILAVNCRGS